MLSLKKNIRWLALLLFIIFLHQLYYISSPSKHGCGADLPIEFLYVPDTYDNGFSGETAITGPDGYRGHFIKVDCDIGGVIIPTGSPKNYILLENSVSIERPLHNLSAIPLRYVATAVLKSFNIPIENTYINIYLSRGKVFQLQFYLSWYYAHVLQNLLIIIFTFYMYSKYIKINLITTGAFYFLFYIPVLGRELLSPDMSLWIPFSVMLLFVTYKEFNNPKNRKKIILITSFSILFYPIFIINYFYLGLRYLKSLFKKQINFRSSFIEGLFLIAPYFSYRVFLSFQDINFVPGTMKYVNENVACTVYCQGVWMFIDANTQNGVLNELFRRINYFVGQGEFNYFVILFLIFFALNIITKKPDFTNLDLFLIIFSSLVFLFFAGNFIDRYINVIPSILIVNSLSNIFKKDESNI